MARQMITPTQGTQSFELLKKFARFVASLRIGSKGALKSTLLAT